MEKEGIVGQANHAGKREILVGEEEPSAIENHARRPLTRLGVRTAVDVATARRLADSRKGERSESWRGLWRARRGLSRDVVVGRSDRDIGGDGRDRAAADPAPLPKDGPSRDRPAQRPTAQVRRRRRRPRSSRPAASTAPSRCSARPATQAPAATGSTATAEFNAGQRALVDKVSQLSVERAAR